jgi:hypothetical protein
MPFQNMEDVLPEPWFGFDPEGDSRRDDGLNDFESLDGCIEEDALSADLLERTQPSLAPELRSRARRLVDALRYAVDDPLAAPATLASRVYARQVRRKLVGNLWPLAEDRAQGPVVFANLVRTNMWVPADNLLSQNPVDMKRRFINDFDRAGLTRASGWLLGTLDAEFDSVRGGYEFHTGLIVSGEKVAALEEVRKRRSYRWGRHAAHELDMRPFHRMRIDRDLNNLPDPLTYAAKMRVWNVPTYMSVTGFRERSRYVSRIPEPHYSHWLLWMDKFSVSDLLITQGLQATQNGFRCTDPVGK